MPTMPEIQLDTKSYLHEVEENKPKLALLLDGNTGSSELPERFLRHKSPPMDWENGFRQSTDFVENPQMAEKAYICSYCGQTFKGTSALMAHERSHIAEKVYKCSQCERPYACRFDLLRHEKNHAGENPHQCASNCGKCFHQNTPMPLCQKICPAEKVSNCPECGESFGSKWQLLQHKKIYRAEQNECSECGNRYKLPSQDT